VIEAFCLVFKKIDILGSGDRDPAVLILYHSFLPSFPSSLTLGRRAIFGMVSIDVPVWDE
jgi:hypothetical protein